MARDNMTYPTTLTALVLAGNRPGGDPLARAAGVSAKALVPVAGEPMVNHVVQALLASDHIGRVIISSHDPQELRDHPATRWLAEEPRVMLETSQGSIAATLDAYLSDRNANLPLLVTTVDHALLTSAMIAKFANDAQGSDLAIAMVEKQTLLAVYPQSKRTWLKFRGGHWSGANLFYLSSTKVAPVIALWGEAEQQRKKPMFLFRQFGPLLLLGIVLRVLTLPQALAAAGRKFGISARLVAMPQAEACIDIDKPADLVLVESILSARPPLGTNG